jgi:hypothetical protein
MGEWVSIMDSLFLNPLWKNPHLAVSGEDSQQNLDQVKISLHKKIINLILEHSFQQIKYCYIFTIFFHNTFWFGRNNSWNFQHFWK